MLVSVVCGSLGEGGAYDFILPISQIESVKKIKIFRDTRGSTHEKMTYIYPVIFKIKSEQFWLLRLLKQVERFLLMCVFIPSNCHIIYGINEMPHGFLSLIVGKIKNIPVCVSVIGNPADGKLRIGIRKKLMYLVVNNVDVVMVCGYKSKSVFIANGVNPNKLHVLPNIVNLDNFREIDSVKKYDIVSVGQLRREKRIDILLRVISLVKLSNSELRVAIAGSGPYKRMLKKLCKRLELSDNVTFLGHISNPSKLYNSSKVFLLTSETEGLPRTMLEAMACGLPCVVSDVGDIMDVAKNNHNSYVVSSYKNLAGYAKAIDVLLKDEEKYRKFSRNGMEYVRENYSYINSEKVWHSVLDKVG
jgi:glycosyltransferase involved in cell wall biosynthesis